MAYYHYTWDGTMYQPNCPSWMRDPPEAYVPGLHPPTSGYPPGTMPRRGPAVVERTAQEYTYTDYRGSHTTQETHTYLNGRGVGRTFGTCHQPPPRVRSQSSHPAPSRHPERERQSSSCRGQEYIATETQHERPDDGYRRPRASHEGPPPRPQPRPPPNAYERHRPSREQEHRGRPEGSSRYREAPRARSQSRAHGGSGSRRSEEPPEQSSHRQRRSSPSARAPPGPNRDPRRSGRLPAPTATPEDQGTASGMCRPTTKGMTGAGAGLVIGRRADARIGTSTRQTGGGGGRRRPLARRVRLRPRPPHRLQ
ncbi:hypothetical protein ISF_08014 [Cordyceps fumosorosea ARSEF 2679]|uniref:Uncharacterized protein n=1 Tax=Cordyceps fumosorosea (strain ARSEF 2679) TaxID=1081104 RepID=A0A167N3N9_CORFA|nr:hypothetical protein ISF_08014 [Cordyceps fumosorosea ARSEF 2679]OAA55093.1 hypothetical protein ISF_08014 [Cordyceps fumosorosea ARSEF 2679]